MNEPPPSAGESRPWSRQIEARYQCRLSDDLRSWFDDNLWNNPEGCSGLWFDCAVPPQELLEPAPDVIWPALMPCDLLPILGNQMGDWLCVRFDADNSASQLIHWYHGGGDWIPWGESLAEAIVFEQLRRSLPGGDRDHAVTPTPETPATFSDRLVDWASEFISSPVSRLATLQGDELAEAMLEAQIGEPAVRCQLVIDALDNPLLTDDWLASLSSDDADSIHSWFFDNALIPAETLQRLADTVGRSAQDVLAMQTWDIAEAHCRRVTEIAPGLAWAWDIIGYAQEKAGRRDAAVECYRRGLDCSIFTDQTVRVRTHGLSREGKKFSAVRLRKLDFSPTDQAERDYFRLLNVEPVGDRRAEIQTHFSEIASRHEADGDPKSAHLAWCRAGWDLGAEPMNAFAVLLERIAATANDSSQSARGALASVHRECFRSRYGM